MASSRFARRCYVGGLGPHILTDWAPADVVHDFVAWFVRRAKSRPQQIDQHGGQSSPTSRRTSAQPYAATPPARQPVGKAPKGKSPEGGGRGRKTS